MIKNTNDGTSRAPYLRCDINGGTWTALPETSTGPRGTDEQILAAAKAAGFAGVQGADAALCKRLGLGATSGGRVNKVGEAGPLAKSLKEGGYECGTLHVGWGMEDDAEVDRLVGDILEASARHDMPLYIETHRATITQDLWRAVQITRRFPDVRFNGDFSHWYTGLEMVYGEIEPKLEFIAPVFERVRFVHGRIGNPGSMQVDIGDGTGRKYVEHFKEMWTRAFAGFLRSAKPGDYICFAPELLQSTNYYARTFRNAAGKEVEEGDRWQQALLYVEIAKRCFADAQQRVAAGRS